MGVDKAVRALGFHVRFRAVTKVCLTDEAHVYEETAQAQSHYRINMDRSDMF